jgi:hypothetical protein
VQDLDAPGLLDDAGHGAMEEIVQRAHRLAAPRTRLDARGRAPAVRALAALAVHAAGDGERLDQVRPEGVERRPHTQNSPPARPGAIEEDAAR